MIGSPSLITPPTVCTASSCTTPSCGARISTRRSWSSAAIRLSVSSEVLARFSARSLLTSVRRSSSIWMMRSSVSATLPRFCAIWASRTPWSPSRRAASRSIAVSRPIWIRFFCQSSRVPFSSCLTHSISLSLAVSCSLVPLICSSSSAICARSCALWPAREERRVANRFRSPSMIRATSGSLCRANRSGGKVTSGAPSRSTSSRARRDVSSSRLCRTISRLARICVSSSRMRRSPALTRSPVRTCSSLTMPTVGCCTFLTLVSTTIWPAAMTAPASSEVAAQPPTPPTSRMATPTPVAR